MLRILFICFLTAMSLALFSQENQEEMPYYQIPDYPEDYSPGNVVSRMIDGLGFRYYWASIDLREDDLNFKPSEEARTSFETLRHIHSLTLGILNTTKNQPTTSFDNSGMDYKELREATLKNIEEASKEMLGKTESDIAELKIVFSRNGNDTEFPFWNLLNGLLSDALWHTGQVVSFRRTSGNPFPSGVSVLRGTKRD